MATNAHLRLPSDQKVAEFIQLLRAGNYIATACDYTGIPERSIYNWGKEAQREDGREWAKQFWQQVQEARAFAQAANLQIIQRAAAEGTWQAAAWFLERSRPQQWALYQRHQVEVTKAEEQHQSPRQRLGAVLEALGQEMAEEDAQIIELPAAHEPNGTNGD